MHSATSRLACALAALADITTGRLGEHARAALDRFLPRADGERRHPSALQGQDPSLGEHLTRHGNRLIGAKLARALLKGDSTQQPRVEHGLALCQLRLDPILQRKLRRGGLWGTD